MKRETIGLRAFYPSMKRVFCAAAEIAFCLLYFLYRGLRKRMFHVKHTEALCSATTKTVKRTMQFATEAVLFWPMAGSNSL